jgi:TolA-binding protein
MAAKRLLLPLTAVAMMSVGCVSEDEFRKTTQEVGDLKLEVFKMRQQLEDSNKRAEAEQRAASEARGQDRRFQADLQETMRQLQDSSRTLSNRVNTLRTAPSAVAPSAPGAPASDEEKAFNAAVLDYNRGNYALAIESLQSFLRAFPQSGRKAEAQFFLGLCHYNSRAYDKAQLVFEQIVRESPTSNQFLPAKLKRAQCLLKQNLKPAAVKAFRELVDGFAGTPEARTAQQELSDLGL